MRRRAKKRRKIAIIPKRPASRRKCPRASDRKIGRLFLLFASKVPTTRIMNHNDRPVQGPLESCQMKDRHRRRIGQEPRRSSRDPKPARSQACSGKAGLGPARIRLATSVRPDRVSPEGCRSVSGGNAQGNTFPQSMHPGGGAGAIAIKPVFSPKPHIPAKSHDAGSASVPVLQSKRPGILKKVIIYQHPGIGYLDPGKRNPQTSP